MKATFHHEITVKFTLWMRSGHALLFLDSMARDPSCSSVFKISLWCYVVFNIQGWLQRLESFHKTREPHKHSGQNSPGLDSSLLEKRKLPKHFDHAQADLKKPTLTLNSKANPANIFPSAHLANADFKSISATGLGQTEALFRSLQHVIHEKGRNKRLRFISLLFSNPSYYRTGTMFMMDLFGEHFLPAHVTVLQTEAKAVWGVIKAANISQYHVQAQCFRSTYKEMSQQGGAGLVHRKLHPVPHCTTMLSHSFSQPHVVK